MGAGYSIYKDWKPFNREDIRRRLGFYIFNVVAPAPQITFRFNSQSKDPIYGNRILGIGTVSSSVFYSAEPMYPNSFTEKVSQLER